MGFVLRFLIGEFFQYEYAELYSWAAHELYINLLREKKDLENTRDNILSECLNGERFEN